MLLATSDLRSGRQDRKTLRIALDAHETALATAVQRMLESSGHCKIVGTAGPETNPSNAMGADVLLILGGRFDTTQRIRQHRTAGWCKGLVVAAADARAEIAVGCLDAGADDYMRLPLDSAEFLSRIHALARRANPTPSLTGPVRLDWQAYAATLGERCASFKKTSFRLFAYLVERAGQWRRSDDLQANVLKACCREGASNVRWHVLEARRALGPMRWCLHSDGRRGFMFDMQPCGLAHCSREPRADRSTPSAGNQS